MAPKGYIRDKNSGQWILPGGLGFAEESQVVPPLPRTPSTGGSWVQLQSPASSAASRAATPPGPIMLVATPPPTLSPGTPPPPTTLAFTPQQAVGQGNPVGLQFTAPTAPKWKWPQQKVAKSSHMKTFANCCKFIRPGLGPCFFPLIVLVILFVIFPASIFPNITRSADAAANLVEDVAGAGGAVALAARNLTMAVSGVALALARNSANFVDEAWSGIDLMGCRLNVTGGRFVVDIGARSRPDMMVELERGLSDVPEDVAVELWTAINGVSARAPVSARISAQFNLSESFFIWDWEVMLVEQEILAVRYYFAQLRFDIQWANPLCWVRSRRGARAHHGPGEGLHRHGRGCDSLAPPFLCPGDSSSSHRTPTLVVPNWPLD